MTPSIRRATPDDIIFVRASWHTNFWKLSARKHVTKNVYDPGQEKRINRLLFESHVLVAFFPEVPEEILGWVCMRQEVLHYAYVKSTYRRRGIASGLVAGQASCYTHATDRGGAQFAASINAQYNPYRLEHP